MSKACVAERLTDAATTVQQVAVQKYGKVPATADAQRVQRSELEEIIAWPCASLPAPRHGMWLRRCGLSAELLRMRCQAQTSETPHRCAPKDSAAYLELKDARFAGAVVPRRGAPRHGGETAEYVPSRVTDE